MSTTVSYKGETLTTVSNATKTLQTEGKYLEDDITLVDVSGGGAVLTTKNISANGTYNASSDSADGYSQVTVAVPASAVDSGTKNITANGNGQDVVGYAAVDVAVPNSYSASDEGKVVSNGALVAQTSDTVTQNGTVDTTLINSLTVNVSGGGTDDAFGLFSGNKWRIETAPNDLSSGGYYEFTFTDATPANDYGNVISIGNNQYLGTYNNNSCLHFYHSYSIEESRNTLIVRNGSTTTPVTGLDFSQPVTIKVDKDYVYVNGTSVIATPSTVKSNTAFGVGSVEGSKRFFGKYISIKHVAGV